VLIFSMSVKMLNIIDKVVTRAGYKCGASLRQNSCIEPPLEAKQLLHSFTWKAAVQMIVF
jgi:hypothetical protein